MESNIHRKSLVGPIILILLGVVFLLNNLGYLDWGVWETILKLWPVLLVVVGVEFILNSGSAWNTLVIVLVVLGVAGFVSLATGAWGNSGRPFVNEETPSSERISEPLGTAKSAELQIEAAIGELHLDATANPQILAEGTIEQGRGVHLEKDSWSEEGKAYLRLSLRGWSGRDSMRRGWNLAVNRTVPLTLRINTGVGVSDLNLSEVKATEILVKTGVGKTSIDLPRTGKVQARIEGGIGETDIAIPPDVAVRLHVETGIGTIEYDGTTLHSGLTDISPDYDRASNRVNLEVKGGIGKIAIHRGSGW